MAPNLKISVNIIIYLFSLKFFFLKLSTPSEIWYLQRYLQFAEKNVFNQVDNVKNKNTQKVCFCFPSLLLIVGVTLP